MKGACEFWKTAATVAIRQKLVSRHALDRPRWETEYAYKSVSVNL